MDDFQSAVSMALVIGAGIVGWAAIRCETLADRISEDRQRIAALEAHAQRCKCGSDDSP